jgi:hypothetical protein
MYEIYTLNDFHFNQRLAGVEDLKWRREPEISVRCCQMTARYGQRSEKLEWLQGTLSKCDPAHDRAYLLQGCSALTC